MEKRRQNIYKQLRLYYILLYISDIEEYRLEDLDSLLNRLQGQLQLEINEQKIHDELIAKSYLNKENKLKQKREKLKRQSQPEVQAVAYKKQQGVIQKQKMTKKKQQTLNQTQLDQSGIFQQPEVNTSLIKKIESQEGKIYDGKLQIKLEIADLTNTVKFQCLFIVNSHQKKSSINKETLTKLKMVINDRNESQIRLMINKRKTLVQLRQGENIIGLDYLRDNKIVQQCNYRSESLLFTMVYTQ